MLRHGLRAALLTVASLPAFAQTVTAPGTPDAGSGQPVVTPKSGQSHDQMDKDRYECHHWAVSQTGFDPASGTASGTSAAPDSYRRAFAACMDGRGYAVHYAAAAPGTYPPPATATPLAPARATSSYVYAPGPELKYHPFRFQVEGGYTFAAGGTGDHFDDGYNIGAGVSFFPAEALPVGVRVDGSYSRFDTRHDLLEEGGYTRGHEDVYGGDVDLQVNLLPRSSRQNLYVLGGAGWYREEIREHQVSFEAGGICGGYFSCGPGEGAATVTDEHETREWRRAWNGGLGWETPVAEHASFFVEARYLRIHRSEFVPIRVGLRF